MTKPPTLTARILAVIEEHPSITATELRFAIPDVNPGSLTSRVSALLSAGRIKSVGFGRYRLPEVPKACAPVAATPRAAITPAFLVPLARLMAGR